MKFGKHISKLMVLCSAMLAILVLGACSAENAAEETTPIRIGWQIPWATQGQIVQSMVNSNVLDLNGLSAEYKGFSYGGPLNEAALANEVDVILTADQPAAMLLSTGADWSIIGRLMYNRVAVYVPPDSDIQTLADLKGKTVAIPFGAAAQRDALKAIQDAGLDPSTDINAINLDILEQAGIVQSGTRESWGDIDALVGFDPTPAIFEDAGLARMLHVGTVVSLVLMAQDYIDAHPEAPEQFMSAFTEAYYYYATHEQEANDWFKTASQLTFDTSVLDIASSVEPNVTAENIDDIRITLSEADLAVLDEAAAFILEQGLITQAVDMRSHVDMSFAEKVSAAFANGNYDATRVKPVAE
jgi:ABC-type nitrate/sulfonate/bicarbonate transport system substrate-binding protein